MARVRKIVANFILDGLFFMYSRILEAFEIVLLDNRVKESDWNETIVAFYRHFASKALTDYGAIASSSAVFGYLIHL